MYNSDGSQGAMCGNGIRCVAKYVYDYGLTDKDEISIATKSGIKYVKLQVENGKVKTVRVDMGAPILNAGLIPIVSENPQVINEAITAGGREYRMTGVSMGNPHCVIFLNKKEELDQIPMEVYGTEMEHHPAFPNGTNVEFAWIQDAGHIFVRVWERGCGETKACGTGACAVAAAAMRMRKCAMSVVVVLPGGELRVTYGTRSRHLYLTGPAEEIFSGEVKIG
jgi:diaminopimelate epimerase